MNGDETAPKRGIASLSKPGDAERLLKAVFPRDTIETVQRITEVPRRSVTRWLQEESRLPPTLTDKLKRQVDLKGAFLDDLRAVLTKHQNLGLLPEVMRQAMLVEVNDDFFKSEQNL